MGRKDDNTAHLHWANPLAAVRPVRALDPQLVADRQWLCVLSPHKASIRYPQSQTTPVMNLKLTHSGGVNGC